MRNELESKLDINTTILGDEPGMSKEVKILIEMLCWHDGARSFLEADQKHAEAIIRGTGASNLTSLKIPMSKESKEEVRDKTDYIVEKKVGKIGHEGTTTCRTDFGALPKPLGIEHWQQLPIFLPLTEETSCTVQKS